MSFRLSGSDACDSPIFMAAFRTSGSPKTFCFPVVCLKTSFSDEPCALDQTRPVSFCGREVLRALS